MTPDNPRQVREMDCGKNPHIYLWITERRGPASNYQVARDRHRHTATAGRSSYCCNAWLVEVELGSANTGIEFLQERTDFRGRRASQRAQIQPRAEASRYCAVNDDRTSVSIRPRTVKGIDKFSDHLFSQSIDRGVVECDFRDVIANFIMNLSHRRLFSKPRMPTPHAAHRLKHGTLVRRTTSHGLYLIFFARSHGSVANALSGGSFFTTPAAFAIWCRRLSDAMSDGSNEAMYAPSHWFA